MVAFLADHDKTSENGKFAGMNLTVGGRSLALTQTRKAEDSKLRRFTHYYPKNTDDLQKVSGEDSVLHVADVNSLLEQMQ